MLFRPACRHEFPLWAAYSRRVLTPAGRLSRPPTTMPDKTPRRHTAVSRCLHTPCLTIPPAPMPPACEQLGSSPVRVPTLSVSWFRIKQEPSGLPEFSDVSLPACQILRTPADIHTLAIERVLHVGFQDVKTVAIRLLCFLEAALL